MSAPVASVNAGKAELTPQEERAAHLQAESAMSVEQIAEAVGVTRQALWLWNKQREYRARVGEINAELDREAYRTPLARKRNRVVKLADMANHIEDRIRKNPKSSPMLLREWRGLYEQIARELGQWTDKLDLSGEVDVRKIEIREVVMILPAETEKERKEPAAQAQTATEAEWREVEPAIPPAPANAYSPEQLIPEELAAIRERRTEGCE